MIEYDSSILMSIFTILTMIMLLCSIRCCLKKKSIACFSDSSIAQDMLHSLTKFDFCNFKIPIIDENLSALPSLSVLPILFTSCGHHVAGIILSNKVC